MVVVGKLGLWGWVDFLAICIGFGGLVLLNLDEGG